MSDKMRGALFSMLGDISGLSVLDTFAGSGALGLEALSRGAAHVIAIEADKTATKVIQANKRALGLDESFKVIRASVAGWSKNNPTALFNIVLADPPYEDLQTLALQRLPTHLKPNGLLVLSWPGHKTPPEFDGCTRLMERNYGDGQLVFYRKSS
jgi:16S rRNA (guanine966-N2)-methyltransferase